jgi:hypothetical protein
MILTFLHLNLLAVIACTMIAASEEKPGFWFWFNILGLFLNTAIVARHLS